MKRVKYLAYWLFSILLVAASLVVVPGMAGAASDYDDVISLANSVRTSDTYDNHNCTTWDLTSTWSNYITDDSMWNHAVYASGADRETAQAAFATAKANGNGIAVSDREFLSGTSIGNFVWDASDHGVQVVFTPDANNEVTFLTNNGVKYATLKGTNANPVYIIVLGQFWDGSTNNCSVGVAALRVVSSNASDSTFLSKEAYIGHSNPNPNYLNIYRQLFTNSLVTYPSGYAGEMVPANIPPATYAALGDSYSSGEGNPPFEYGTDVNNGNGCHRSVQAYPRLLQSNLNLGTTAFVACSGATTSTIISGQWNEPAQIDALTSSIEKVTLTIGGNDVGFPEYAQGCFVACGPNGPGAALYDAMIDGITQPAFKANLINTYEEILQAAPNADVYVADYPYLVTSSTTVCWGFDFSGAYTIQTMLNGVIHDAVNAVHASNSRIHFVETNYSGSPFENGELCGGSG